MKFVLQLPGAVPPEQDAKSMHSLPCSLVLRVCARLCGHRARWHHARSLSWAKRARFGTIYFMLSAWSEPWSKLVCQLSLGFLLEQNECIQSARRLGSAGIAAVGITST